MQPICIDLEPATSTIRIGERRFPACVVRCPPTEYQRNDPPDSLVLGSKAGATSWLSAFVPMENGAMINVEWTRGRCDAVLYARTCALFPDATETIWLPHHLHLMGRRICAGCKGPWEWRLCEAEWLAEHIERLSTYAYTEPEGPACELIPLKDWWSRPRG